MHLTSKKISQTTDTSPRVVAEPLEEVAVRYEAEVQQEVALQPALAGVGVRALAYIIDGVLLVAVSLLFERWFPGSSERGFLEGTAFDSFYLMANWLLRGATPGMNMLGLKIVRTDDWGVDPITVFIRCVGYWLCFLTLGLGFLWAVWDPYKQGLHDKMAGTLVIKSHYSRSVPRL